MIRQLIDRLLGRDDAEARMLAATEQMLTAKADDATRLRAAMAQRIGQSENRMRDLHAELTAGRIEGIRRRQADEDFARAARDVELSRREAELLQQSLLDAQEVRAKLAAMRAAGVRANESELLLNLKSMLDGLEQRNQMRNIAMGELRAAEVSVGLAPAATDVAAPTLAAADVETTRAAERQRTLDALLRPMSH